MLATLVRYLLRTFELLLVIRAVLSWIPAARGSRVSYFLEMTTEPILMPVRSLLARIPALRSVPIDFSFLIVFMILEGLEALL